MHGEATTIAECYERPGGELVHFVTDGFVYTVGGFAREYVTIRRGGRILPWSSVIIITFKTRSSRGANGARVAKYSFTLPHSRLRGVNKVHVRLGNVIRTIYPLLSTRSYLVV